MDPAAPKQALEQARAFEKQGQVDSAVRAYVQGGAVEDAARLLVAAKRFKEAGTLLFGSLGIADTAKLTQVDPAKKKRALMSGICFANAGETARAVDIFLKLGERARAVDILQKVGDVVTAARIEKATDAELPLIAYAAPVRSGAAQSLVGAQKLEKEGKVEEAFEVYLALKQYGHAGRVAHTLKRPGQAAELFSEGGMPYEAAVCYLEAGDTGKCLEALIRVPKDDKRYRSACAHAVKLANDLGALEFSLEHFLGKFVATGPLDDRELETFYNLAKLYLTHDHPENARECYQKILARNPAYRDAALKLKELEEEGKNSAKVYEKILKEEQTFRAAVNRHDKTGRVGGGGGDDLPDLPDLPSLPPTPALGLAAAQRAATAGAATVAQPGMVPPGAVPYGMPPGAVPYGMPPGVPTAYPYPGSGPVPMTAYPYPGSPYGVPGYPPGYATPPPGYTTPPPGYGTPPAGYPAPAPASHAPSDPNAAGASTLAEGVVVSDRYRLEKKIGQGGMGAVYRAFDNELSEQVAIKFFSHAVADEQMLARFKQEVTLSRQLNHPNIIRLYDIGTFRDYKYITMELLQGQDLNHLIAGKAMALGQGLDILIQACQALELVHQKGVIHRDIKPDNFFVTNDGVVKVMDFGISKKTGQAGMTVAGMIAGTPEYMSPEQINDLSSVTKATDLYALGVMAYLMFTGTLPFTHQELMPLLVMHVTVAPDAPRARNPNVPPDLEAVILQLLEKEADKRIASCAELGRRLAAIRQTVG